MEQVHKAQVRKVKLQDYEITQTIGYGTFSKAKIFRHKTTSKYLIGKMYKKIDLINNRQIEHLLNEVKILTFISAQKSPFVRIKNLKKYFFFLTLKNR